MTPNLDDLTARERRLCEVIAAYYQATEDGHAPELKTLVQEHPDLQAELTRYFVEQELLHQVARPLRSPQRRDTALGSDDLGTLQRSQPGSRQPGRPRAARGRRASVRRLRAVGEAGDRRHGGRLQGPAGQPQPAGGA